MATLSECMSVFEDEEYYHPYVKALEKQRRLYTANLGIDMGDDWFGPKGDKFRHDSLVYYVKMFLQATMIRQFRMAATQIHGMIKSADETSKIASLDPIQMLAKEARDMDEVEDLTKTKIPEIFMEKLREQAKARRTKARKLSRR